MKSQQKLARVAILIALCVVLGYLFLPVPNLEMITVGIFLSGVWAGPFLGLLIGLASEAIYSITNPMGFPPPPLLLAQLLAMSLVGLCGGLMSGLLTRLLAQKARRWLVSFICGSCGILLTFVYDALTNLSFPLAAGFSAVQMRAALILGIPYAVIHIGANAAIFALIIPLAVRRFPLWRLT